MPATRLFAGLVVLILTAASLGVLLAPTLPQTPPASVGATFTGADHPPTPMASAPRNVTGVISATVTFSPSNQIVSPMGAVYDAENDTLVTFNNPKAPGVFFTATPGNLTASTAVHTLSSYAYSATFDPSLDSIYFLELNSTGAPTLQQYNVSSGVLATPVGIGGTGYIGCSEVFDPANGLVYVATASNPSLEPNAGNLTALDTQTGTLVTNLPTLPSAFIPEMLALSSNDSTLFIGGMNSSRYGQDPMALLAINLTTFAETEVALPGTASPYDAPGSIAFDPTDDAVYYAWSSPIGVTGQNASENVSVIAAAPLHVVTTISLPVLRNQYGLGAGSITFDPTNSYLYLGQNPNSVDATATSVDPNATVVAINGTSTTAPNPAGFLHLPARPAGAAYVPPAAPGEGGELWFASNVAGYLSGQFDVLTVPLYIENFSATPAALDLGSPLHLAVSTEYGAGPLTYQYTGLPANCTAADAPTLACAPSAAGATTVVVNVTDPLGDDVSAQTVVRVNPSLAARPLISPASPDVGQVVEFAANPSGGAPPYLVSWSFGDGSNASGSIAVHSYRAAGTYLATLRDQDALGVTVTQTFSVRVASVPSNAAIVANRTWTDVGVAVGFSAIAQNGTAPIQENWSFGDGSPAAVGSVVSHTFVRPGTYLVALTVTDADGLSTGSSIWISVAPDPSATLLSTPVTIAAGDSVTFDESVAGGTSPYSYLWSFGDGSASTSASPVHEFGAPGRYTVSVRVTDAAGLTVTNQTTVVVTAASTNSTTSGGGTAAGLSATDAALLALGSAVVGVVAGGLLVAVLTRRGRGPPP